MAPQAATTLALTTPATDVEIEFTVTPFTVAVAPPFTLTASVFNASSASVTLAIVAVAPASPARRVTPTAAMVGAVLLVVQATATLLTLAAPTVPLPLVTAQVCAGLPGCANTVTA